MKSSRMLPAAFALFAFTLAGTANADAIVPEEGARQGMAAGAACDNAGVPGNCTAKKCTRLDYRDGSPPGTKEVDCVVCVNTGVATDAGGDSGKPAAGSDGGSSTAAVDGGTKATETNDDGGGCSIMATPAARAAGPWLLALAPMLLMRFGRRGRKGTKP